ncbi:MAG: GTPase [Phycisphaerae bacterium]
MTASGTGAIAVIAVGGSRAGDAVAELYPQAKHLSTGGVKRATLVFQGQEIDDALIVCRTAINFEIHAHGGVAVVEQILAALRAAGATVSDAPLAHGDWLLDDDVATAQHYSSAPAILREVLETLPTVDNLFTLRLLTCQHTTGLAAWARKSIMQLQTLSQAQALWLVESQAQWIMRRSSYLRHFLQAPRIVLIGEPNAGKSTLLNALAGRSASITSTVAGTTRDWVDVTIRLTADAVSLNAIVVDTAGLRPTNDPLEQEAIRRSHQQTRRADVVVVVLDGSTELIPVLPPTAEPWRGESPAWIYAINKMDRPLRMDPRKVSSRGRAVQVSALCGDGIDELHAAILETLGLGNCTADTPWVWTPRQRRILDALAAAETTRAAEQLFSELSAA